MFITYYTCRLSLFILAILIPQRKKHLHHTFMRALRLSALLREKKLRDKAVYFNTCFIIDVIEMDRKMCRLPFLSRLEILIKLLSFITLPVFL